MSLEHIRWLLVKFRVCLMLSDQQIGFVVGFILFFFLLLECCVLLKH